MGAQRDHNGIAHMSEEVWEGTATLWEERQSHIINDDHSERVCLESTFLDESGRAQVVEESDHVYHCDPGNL